VERGGGLCVRKGYLDVGVGVVDGGNRKSLGPNREAG